MLADARRAVNNVPIHATTKQLVLTYCVGALLQRAPMCEFACFSGARGICAAILTLYKMARG